MIMGNNGLCDDYRIAIGVPMLGLVWCKPFIELLVRCLLALWLPTLTLLGAISLRCCAQLPIALIMLIEHPIDVLFYLKEHLVLWMNNLFEISL